MRRERQNSTVFLGGGRITSALVAGLQLAKYAKPIVVHDHNPQKLAKMKRAYGISGEPSLRRAVELADLLVLAVRPDSVSDVTGGWGELSRSSIAVSLVAGVPLTKLRALTSGPITWVRAMPSPLCRSGEGLTALAFEARCSAAVKDRVRRFFTLTGTVLELPESKFDAFTVSYSPSHGYHALAALASAAESCGLDRKTALTAAAHALSDSIATWRESEQSLGELLGESATPGGIAAAVMQTLDRAGYPDILKRSLRAGMRRAKANART